jgi:hypothetical protein
MLDFLSSSCAPHFVDEQTIRLAADVELDESVRMFCPSSHARPVHHRAQHPPVRDRKLHSGPEVSTGRPDRALAESTLKCLHVRLAGLLGTFSFAGHLWPESYSVTDNSGTHPAGSGTSVVEERTGLAGRARGSSAAGSCYSPF